MTGAVVTVVLDRSLTQIAAQVHLVCQNQEKQEFKSTEYIHCYNASWDKANNCHCHCHCWDSACLEYVCFAGTICFCGWPLPIFCFSAHLFLTIHTSHALHLMFPPPPLNLFSFCFALATANCPYLSLRTSALAFHAHNWLCCEHCP